MHGGIGVAQKTKSGLVPDEVRRSDDVVAFLQQALAERALRRAVDDRAMS